jgi:hypothetical protein
MYAVTFRDAKSGDTAKTLVSITTSNLKSIDGIILSTLPEKLALENNIRVSNWPQ